MEPFARGLGEFYLRTPTKPAFRMLMRLQGIQDMSAVTSAELDPYVDLLRETDGGRAFLQIMRGFERTAQKRELYRSVLSDRAYPVQIVWGANDPGLTLSEHGELARRAASLHQIRTVPAKTLPPRGPSPRDCRARLPPGSSLTGGCISATGISEVVRLDRLSGGSGVEFFDAFEVGLAEGGELGDGVAQDLERDLCLDRQRGLVDPFAGQRRDDPGADQHLTLASASNPRAPLGFSW